MNKPNTERPAWIELREGYAFQLVGKTYVPTKNGHEICWPWQAQDAQAFAAAMAPQDGLREVSPITPEILTEAQKLIGELDNPLRDAITRNSLENLTATRFAREIVRLSATPAAQQEAPAVQSDADLARELSTKIEEEAKAYLAKSLAQEKGHTSAL